jgi:hypothetical protein
MPLWLPESRVRKDLGAYCAHERASFPLSSESISPPLVTKWATGDSHPAAARWRRVCLDLPLMRGWPKPPVYLWLLQVDYIRRESCPEYEAIITLAS